MTGHAVYWVRPIEQRQILRIILFDVIFSLTSFFSIYFYVAAAYSHAFAIYYEGFAMTALFLLYVQLVCPVPTDRAQYFSNLQRLWVNGKVKDSSNGSLRWFRVSLCLHAAEQLLTLDRLYGSACFRSLSHGLQRVSHK